ncbi:hypothetical protein RJ55_03812 [Drechmeria coniospora]|nr:hypothetical protein RJ55_03812 [Drechmeria coniospora]
MGNAQATVTSEPSVGRLTTLSRAIEEKTKILADSLEAKGLGAPSFHPDGLADFPSAQLGPEAVQARADIISMTQELHDLALGPRESLKALSWDNVSFVSLQAICEFKLADAVPREGSISYVELATKVRKQSSVDVPYYDLRRILRLAMLNNLFTEPKPDHVAHNRSSLLLLEDENLANWLGLYTIDFFSPMANTVSAMKKWPASQDDCETGLNLAHGYADNLFAQLSKDKVRAKRFDSAMKCIGAKEGFEVSHTVECYPWGDLGKATVVDMGGNEGFASAAIAEAFPLLSFEVQDLPGIALNAKIPTHLADRVRHRAHNFFDEQPVIADAYLFRHVFHAFSDKSALAILRALVPALRPGARIIINDVTLRPPGEMARIEEKSVRLLDMLMKTVRNARNRDADEWKSLFEQADARFKWKGTWKTSGRMWFMEAVWEGEGRNAAKDM